MPFVLMSLSLLSDISPVCEEQLPQQTVSPQSVSSWRAWKKGKIHPKLNSLGCGPEHRREGESFCRMTSVSSAPK